MHKIIALLSAAIITLGAQDSALNPSAQNAENIADFTLINAESTESQSLDSTNSTDSTTDSTQSANIAESHADSVADSTDSTESNTTDSTNATNSTISKDSASTDSTATADSTDNPLTPSSANLLKQMMIGNAPKPPMPHPAAAQAQQQSFLDGIDAHIGFFGKTNALSYAGRDDYINFNASLGLEHNLFNTITLGLGIYGMTGIKGWENGKTTNAVLGNYIQSKFIANEAFIKYANSMDFFSFTAGRYATNRVWLKHFIQGVSMEAHYEWFDFWLDWADEMAIANREMLQDFKVFKNDLYGTNSAIERHNQWLIALGIDLSVYGVDISPYYYMLNKYFWNVGAKLGILLNITDNWTSQTTANYSRLKAKTIDSAQMGDSKILWIDEAIRYAFRTEEILFGLGYVKVWDNNFTLAKLGNESRFEISDLGDESLGVVAPGGLSSGINSTNMFEGETQTIYGFAGFDVDFLAMMLLGRYSKSTAKTQDSYSLGIKYKIIEGLNIGGVGAYMLENKANKSFLKAYIEFAI